MQFIIISGLSGAGKSKAASDLEDLGFYCVDNMPAEMIPQFASLCLATKGRFEKVALVTDIREREGFAELFPTLDQLWDMGLDYRILFVEAAVPAIVKRYKETRRKHPHAKGGLLIDGIATERRLLSEIRSRSDYIIDTTGLMTKQLKEQILALFESRQKYESMNISVISFGFKRGIPLDSDLMFDVRFLPNPFYEASLKPLTGLDAPVRDFVLNRDVTQAFIKKLHDMVEFLLPQYVEEGKMQLVISIGCTGGQHRSVALAEELGQFLSQKNYYTVVTHRDIKLEQEGR